MATSMDVKMDVKITPQGLLIPRAIIGDWLDQELEIIKDQERIIIQPKIKSSEARERVLQVLASSGLLIKPDLGSSSPPVSSAEMVELAEKFSQGRPLSEIVIEERKEGW